MKNIILSFLFILLSLTNLVAQYAEPAVTGANFVPGNVDVGQNALLTISFANSGSTPIPAGSIELTISTASTYYATDGTTVPAGTGGALFTWTYLGTDTWRGSNTGIIPAYGGGNVTLQVKGVALSPGFEVTNINVQPVSNFAAFNDSPNNNNLQPKLKVNQATVGCVTFNLKVLLEGPYESATGKMSTMLNQRGLLPGQTHVGPFGVDTPAGQPYKGAPWNYNGTEGIPSSIYANTVVDWVLVSLRTDSTSASSTVLRKAALLHDDGHITFVESCYNLPTGKYFVVIEHRNHMGVMSGRANVQSNTLAYDFTLQDSYIIDNPPSFGQIQVNGKWMMHAGDGKKDTFTDNYDINFNDSQLWKSESGFFDKYLNGDFNMDADVNFLDSVIWKKNNGRYSVVPR